MRIQSIRAPLWGLLLAGAAGWAGVAPGLTQVQPPALMLDRGFVRADKPLPESLRLIRPRERLADLPAAVDFSASMPPVIDQNQGSSEAMNSCTAWACGYYAFGFLVGEEQGWDPGETNPDHLFSAMMLFWLCTRGENVGNPIGVDPDPAAGKYSPLSWLMRRGLCSVSQWGGLWPYWYQRRATTADLVNAGHYRTVAPGRLAVFYNNPGTEGPYDNDIDLVKAELAARNPVVVGFGWRNVANPVNPTSPDYMWDYGQAGATGAHAICLIGYDDSHGGIGAFKAIDSNGTGQGDQGFVWLSYSLVRQGADEAWVIVYQDVTVPSISEGEYFFGPRVHDLDQIDPRAGGAAYDGLHSLTAADGGFDERIEKSAPLSIDTHGMRPGLYSGGARYRDASGEWGATRRFEFRLDGAVDLSSAEAYFDDDPGEGLGIALSARDGAIDENVESLAAALDTGEMAAGLHQVFVRTKDDAGRWGLARGVTVEMYLPPTSVHVAAAEWALDGLSLPGTGYPMTPVDGAFDGAEETLQALRVTPGWPGPNDRVLYVRVQDSRGQWSANTSRNVGPPPTPTPSPTPSPSSTPSPTESTTPSITPSSTPSFTASWTPSPSPTANPSPSASVSPTPIPTLSPTASPRPTLEPSPTSSPLPTDSLTPTPTASTIPSPTASETVSPTSSPSPSSTASPTAPTTPTLTPSPTASVTPETSFTPQPSFTPLSSPLVVPVLHVKLVKPSADPPTGRVTYRYAWRSSGANDPPEILRVKSDDQPGFDEDALYPGDQGATFDPGETWMLTVTPYDEQGNPGGPSTARFVIEADAVTFSGWLIQ